MEETLSPEWWGWEAGGRGAFKRWGFVDGEQVLDCSLYKGLVQLSWGLGLVLQNG